MDNYHWHMEVTHFLDYAEHDFLEKGTSPEGVNEDKLESIKKVPETRTLKNTQKRRVHQQMPTQGFKKYPKEKNIKKWKSCRDFQELSKTAWKNEARDEICGQARRWGGQIEIRLRNSMILKNAELWISKDADPKWGRYGEKKYRQIQGMGRDLFLQQMYAFRKTI